MATTAQPTQATPAQAALRTSATRWRYFVGTSPRARELAAQAMQLLREQITRREAFRLHAGADAIDTLPDGRIRALAFERPELERQAPARPGLRLIGTERAKDLILDLYGPDTSTPAGQQLQALARAVGEFSLSTHITGALGCPRPLQRPGGVVDAATCGVVRGALLLRVPVADDIDPWEAPDWLTEQTLAQYDRAARQLTQEMDA